MWIAFILLSFIIPLAVTVGIIVLIVRLVSHKGGSKNSNSVGFREVLLATLVVSAGIAGLAGLFSLPYSFTNDDEGSSSIVLVTHLISAMVLLGAGLGVKNFTGKFIMSLGVILLLGATIPAFESLGSIGALLAVILAFAVLIIITVRVSKKANNG